MYTLELVVNLDFIPEGAEYDLVLYDKHGRLLEIGKKNRDGERSLRLPAWCMEDGGYILKVRSRDENGKMKEEEYQLSFRENRLCYRDFSSHVEEKLREKEEKQRQERRTREKAGTSGDDLEDENRSDIRVEKKRKQKYWKYEEYYAEQMEIPCKPPLEFRA